MNREMKSTPIPWIRDIPVEWDVGRVKHEFTVTLGKMISPNQTSSEQTLENYLCATNIKWSGVDTSTCKQMWFTDSEKEQYLLADGDTLIMEGGTVGTATVYHGEFAPCYIQNSVHRCRGRDKIENKFLYYWMNVVQEAGYIDTICNKATIQHYTKDKVRETPIVLIPVDEQHAIVRYLDSKCAAIDEAIERHKKIIEKLNNYKESIISKYVTKGLSQAVEKQSGIQSIGSIPKHWHIIRLKYLCVKPITDGTHQTPVYTEKETGAPFLSSKDVKNGYIDWDNIKYITLELHNQLHKEVSPQKDDILLAKNGTTGVAALVESDAVFDIYVTLALIRPNKAKVYPRFLLYAINSKSSKLQFNQQLKGIGVPNLHLNMIKETFITLPPVPEQINIADKINNKLDGIKTIEERHYAIIEKLEEYRKSIIYHAVTGKIDCREE